MVPGSLVFLSLFVRIDDQGRQTADTFDSTMGLGLVIGVDIEAEEASVVWSGERAHHRIMTRVPFDVLWPL